MDSPHESEEQKMDCLIHLTAVCLLSPTQLAVRADVSTQIAGDVSHWTAGHNYGGALLGHIGLEMPLATTRHFVITAGYVHESLLDTDRDRGEERMTLGLVWRPFK